MLSKIHLLGCPCGAVFLKLLKCSRYWLTVSDGEYTGSVLFLMYMGGLSATFPTMLCAISLMRFQQSLATTHGQYSTCNIWLLKI